MAEYTEISEKKMQIVIDNYFKLECDVNTSIRKAYEKGFRTGVKKGLSVRPQPKWTPVSEGTPPNKEREEYDNEYIVTIDGDRHYVTTSFWTRRYDTGEWGWNDDNVIAWMEMPKPHGGNKDDAS